MGYRAGVGDGGFCAFGLNGYGTIAGEPVGPVVKGDT